MKVLFQLNPYNQQRQYEKPRNIYPVLLAMYATYLRNQGHKVIWDKPYNNDIDKLIISENQIDVPFLRLPHADRRLTDGFNKKWQKNGNFKYLPATYIMASNSCWWKKCTFCIECNQEKYEAREPKDVWEEIIECKKMGFKEIFDDSGTFPIGGWLDEFLSFPIHKYHKVTLGCNLRLVDVDYKSMKQVGFRMLLFGLESANQDTLDRINKGTKVEDVKYIIKASQAGLDCHIACMFGFPWETDEMALNTLRTIWRLLKKGYAKTAQASFYQPPDVYEARLLKYSHKKYINRIYDVYKSPEFWFRKIKNIRDMHDLKYLWKSIKAGINAKMQHNNMLTE